MAFVASPVTVVSGPLPLMVDLGGSSQFAQCPFSHIRLTGAGTATFDSGQVGTGVAGVETVVAIPGAARSVTIAGTTAQFGKMD